MLCYAIWKSLVMSVVSFVHGHYDIIRENFMRNQNLPLISGDGTAFAISVAVECLFFSFTQLLQ
jgi:hypothetical protein